MFYNKEFNCDGVKLGIGIRIRDLRVTKCIIIVVVFGGSECYFGEVEDKLLGFD